MIRQSINISTRILLTRSLRHRAYNNGSPGHSSHSLIFLPTETAGSVVPFLRPVDIIVLLYVRSPRPLRPRFNRSTFDSKDSRVARQLPSPSGRARKAPEHSSASCPTIVEVGRHSIIGVAEILTLVPHISSTHQALRFSTSTRRRSHMPRQWPQQSHLCQHICDVPPPLQPRPPSAHHRPLHLRHPLLRLAAAYLSTSVHGTCPKAIA